MTFVRAHGDAAIFPSDYRIGDVAPGPLPPGWITAEVIMRQGVTVEEGVFVCLVDFWYLVGLGGWRIAWIGVRIDSPRQALPS